LEPPAVAASLKLGVVAQAREAVSLRRLALA